MIEYDIFRPWLTLDEWQKEYIATEGDCFISCGRQSGKSAGASIKFGDRAAKNPKQIILMLAYTENQAYLLFFKTLTYLQEVYPKLLITKGDKKPTKHIINLTNGSKIMCYAAGLTGEGIRGHTVTSLVIDEAAAMAREVFVAITPMLSVTKGTLDIMSTARGKHHSDGKEKFFYSCSKNPKFKKFLISAEDCPRHTKEFLEEEKKRMTKLEYAQEYLSQFLDEVKQFFPDELVRYCFKDFDWSIFKGRIPQVNHFLGIDVAGQGKDKTVLVSGDRIDRKYIIMTGMDVKPEIKLTALSRLIIKKDLHAQYKKIYLDSGGLGVGVLHTLMEDRQTKWKTMGINNASVLDEHKWVKGREAGKKSRLMKEELYINLKILMENGLLYLQKSDELFQSLVNIQAEDVNGELRIWGRESHITEALIRMAWSIRDKTLNSYIS